MSKRRYARRAQGRPSNPPITLNRFATYADARSYDEAKKVGDHAKAETYPVQQWIEVDDRLTENPAWKTAKWEDQLYVF